MENLGGDISPCSNFHPHKQKSPTVPTAVSILCLYSTRPHVDNGNVGGGGGDRKLPRGRRDHQVIEEVPSEGTRNKQYLLSSSGTYRQVRKAERDSLLYCTLQGHRERFLVFGDPVEKRLWFTEREMGSNDWVITGVVEWVVVHSDGYAVAVSELRWRCCERHRTDATFARQKKEDPAKHRHRLVRGNPRS